jgi:hypothetical protein
VVGILLRLLLKIDEESVASFHQITRASPKSRMSRIYAGVDTVELYAFPSVPCGNRSRSVNSRMIHPPEKRMRKTRTNAKNVATHVATPAISGGKSR